MSEEIKLPDVVVIGPITYELKEVDDLHTITGAGVKQWLNGHIVYGDATIKVAADQAHDMKVTTVWHEALHGLLDQAGIDEHPEALVRALGYALVRFLRDNPALVAVTVSSDKRTSEG